MNKYKICYAGLLANYPEIQMAEVFKFPLDESFMKSINEIFSASMLPSPQTIEEWFKRGIGEMGLPLSTFYCLTPLELDLAYDGYLRRQELTANLVQLSILQSQDPKPIKISEESDTHIGSLEERKQTFLNLGLQEDKI